MRPIGCTSVTRIFFEQGKSWAIDLLSDIHSSSQPLRERCLARSQLTIEQDEFPPLHYFAQPHTQALCLSHAMADDVEGETPFLLRMSGQNATLHACLPVHSILLCAWKSTPALELQSFQGTNHYNTVSCN